MKRLSDPDASAFVAILVDEASAAAPDADDRGWRFRVHREEGETRIELHEEQVWPERVTRADANHFRVQHTVGLNRDQARWVREQLGKALGVPADLTNEEREALQAMQRDIYRGSNVFDEASWFESARDILDKLLAGGGR